MDQNAIELVNEFIQQQIYLCDAFFARFPDTDDLLQGVPRAGNLEINNELWEFRIHGRGVMFRRTLTDAKIDVPSHLNLPDAIDACRLTTYVHSLGIESVSIGDATFTTDDHGIRDLFTHLILAGVLEPLPYAPELATVTKRGFRKGNNESYKK